ncbi:hypothetical protein D5C12_17955 [Salmonella enterica subsp. enterica]|nr:hypothetical protein [Salmonella enterica subsp. enterica]ECG1606623.1 hypothetical protein [Salmonella enterica subsp. enterica]ECR5889350.1 hypothetical protein [Salmonella enterica subsp. enterica]
MSKSNYKFERWIPQSQSSWAWRVFKKHNNELLRMLITFDNSHKFTYSNLKEKGANFESEVISYFDSSLKLKGHMNDTKFKNIKEWSNSFNELQNWMNLNALLAMMSNLETYMATVIPLAIESDIGVLYGVSKRIDGIELLKHGKQKNHGIKEMVIGCTKGTWQSRVNTYIKIFDHAPDKLIKNISELDKMQDIRNKIAHAFGRDIESSRANGKITTLPSEKIKNDKLIEFQTTVWQTAKVMDFHLQNSHIGEYLRVLFYHNMQKNLNTTLHKNEKAVILKKRIGKFGDVSAGKEFCQGLVEYYDKL